MSGWCCLPGLYQRLVLISVNCRLLLQFCRHMVEKSMHCTKTIAGCFLCVWGFNSLCRSAGEVVCLPTTEGLFLLFQIQCNKALQLSTLLLNWNIHTCSTCDVFQSTQQSTPALLTSARLPLFHRTNWESANGIMRVESPHKWSPWWGAGSPNYPLTLFKALPFTVSQTAALRLQQSSTVVLVGAVLRALADVTGMAFPFVAKMKFIFVIFWRFFLKQSGFIALYCWGRQWGHMQTQKLTWLV